MKFAAAIIQVGTPMRSAPIARPAVSTVATHGTSRRLRLAHERGSRPSSESWDSVREAPASGCIVPMNMLAIRNQIAAALAPPASSGANVGPSVRHQLAAHPGGPDGAEPHDGEDDEEQTGHRAAGEHGARDVARRVLGLADVAGGGLERGGGEADEVQARHRAR